PLHPLTSSHNHRDLHSFPTRRSSDLVELNACNDAVDPFADCAVGVVVEGIHPRILKTAVGLDAVPSFPDRRGAFGDRIEPGRILDRKSTRLNSSHVAISYAVFCLKKK